MAVELVTSENREEYNKKKMAQRRGEKPEAEEKKESVKGLSEKYEKEGIESDLFDGKRGIELSRIVVPKEKRGEGIGSKFMEELTGHADKMKKRIVLSPSTDFGASSIARLKEFYKKHGFVENKGKNKDYEISHLMYRNPTKEED